MKKLLIVGNCLFFCIAAVLGAMLYASETRERPVKVVKVIQTAEPLPIPSSQSTFLPENEIPKRQTLEESFYLPFGELPLPVLQQYAENKSDRLQYSLREDNPIDAAFTPYWSLPTSTPEDNGLADSYKECWEAEALHALDLLGATYNSASEHAMAVPADTKNNLSNFVQIAGTLYADTFRWDGSIYPGTSLMAKAAFYRSYTFYLYDLLAYMDVHPDFVFDSRAALEEWDYLLE